MVPRGSQKYKKIVKIRRFWKIRPVTRIKPSAKTYRRPQAKRHTKEELKEVVK